MTGRRPRRSTVLVVLAFLLVLALYLWVRPDPGSTTSSTTPTSTTVSP